MGNYVHYLRRELIRTNYRNAENPWFAKNKRELQGLDVPTYHVTRSTTGPATRVRKGDTIWIFSQLFTPWGNFPPALDAKISVDRIVRVPAIGSIQRGFHYEAGKDSRWFPLCDATECIRLIRTKNSDGKISPLLSRTNQPIGQALQAMRELNCVKPLHKWAKEVAVLPLDFISYRLLDGTRLAFEHAIRLVTEKRSVFWDRWSLPRGLAERREILNDEALNSYITRQINRCSYFWAIRTPKYAEAGTYSAHEFAEASRLGRLKK